MKILPLIQALRPKQWTKNAVVLAAFVFALGDPGQSMEPVQALRTALEAMFLFCLVSSAVYLLNDLRDRALDRQHPVKKNRPIASGQVRPITALVTAGILLTVGLTGAYWIEPNFFLILSAYLVLQIAYTLKLKQIALLDIFIIASGFVLRAMGGGFAIGVAVSPWLLLCTLLLALFLALCKRRQERIHHETGDSRSRPSLQDYDEQLLDQLVSMTGAATMVSYALYTLAPETVAKFGSYKLGFTIPFVIFGIFRYLDLVYRHKKGERPEQVLLTDGPLLVTVGLYGLTAIGLLLWL